MPRHQPSSAETRPRTAAAPPSTTLVLVGGGHAHVQVMLSQRFPASVRRVLVSDGERAVYSGLLPAVIAGQAQPSHADVCLRTLAARHGWEFVHARVTAVRAADRALQLAPRDGGAPRALSYDLLSLDVGSTARRLPGKPAAAVVYTRPIADLLDRVRAFEHAASARAGAGQRVRVAVVGGGVAAVELAFTLEARLRHTLPAETALEFSIVASVDEFGTALGAAGPTVSAELRARNVKMRMGHRVRHIDGNDLVLDSGSRVGVDLVVVATGAAAHKWLAEDTDLETDVDGFLSVAQTLQTTRFPNVFAVGDCAGFGNQFGPGFPPKAGVYAVRMGPILEHNLILACTSTASKAQPTLQTFTPQATALQIINLGAGGRAIGSKGRLVVKGHWVLNLKTYLDRRWQSKFLAKSSATAQDDMYGKQFVGSPVEGAAILYGPESTNSDDFHEQNAVLRRMDADPRFAESVLACSSLGSKVVS